MSGDRATKGRATASGGKSSDWDAHRDLAAGWQGANAPAVGSAPATGWDGFAGLVETWQHHEIKSEFAKDEENLLSSEEMYWLRESELKEVGQRLVAKGLTQEQASLAVAIIKDVGLAAAEHLAPTGKLPRRKRGAFSDQELEDMAAMRNVPPGLDAVEVARRAKSAKEALRWRRRRSPGVAPRNE